VSARDYLPSSVLAWLELGRVYEQLDDLDEARRHYARVVRDLEDADPALRPLAEEARGALRRLQGLKRL
jgi:tetratricopeptide (TPR) repeat protein